MKKGIFYIIVMVFIVLFFAPISIPSVFFFALSKMLRSINSSVKKEENEKKSHEQELREREAMLKARIHANKPRAKQKEIEERESGRGKSSM